MFCVLSSSGLKYKGHTGAWQFPSNGLLKTGRSSKICRASLSWLLNSAENAVLLPVPNVASQPLEARWVLPSTRSPCRDQAASAHPGGECNFRPLLNGLRALLRVSLGVDAVGEEIAVPIQGVDVPVNRLAISPRVSPPPPPNVVTDKHRQSRGQYAVCRGQRAHGDERTSSAVVWGTRVRRDRIVDASSNLCRLSNKG